MNFFFQRFYFSPSPIYHSTVERGQIPSVRSRMPSGELVRPKSWRFGAFFRKFFGPPLHSPSVVYSSWVELLTRSTSRAHANQLWVASKPSFVVPVIWDVIKKLKIMKKIQQRKITTAINVPNVVIEEKLR